MEYEIVVQPNAIEPKSKIDIIVFMTDAMGIKRTFLNMTYHRKDEGKGLRLARQRIDEQKPR